MVVSFLPGTLLSGTKKKHSTTTKTSCSIILLLHASSFRNKTEGSYLIWYTNKTVHLVKGFATIRLPTSPAALAAVACHSFFGPCRSCVKRSPCDPYVVHTHTYVSYCIERKGQNTEPPQSHDLWMIRSDAWYYSKRVCIGVGVLSVSRCLYIQYLECCSTFVL